MSYLDWMRTSDKEIVAKTEHLRHHSLVAGKEMDSFKICLFFISVALLSLHTAVNATEYTIPEAVFPDQGFSLDGSTMAGSVFKYTNSRNCKIYFDFKFHTPLSSQATVTFKTGDDKDKVFNNDTVVTSTAASAQFSLTGSWSKTDKGEVRYLTMNGTSAACEKTHVSDWNATNLDVWGLLGIQESVSTTLQIWTSDNCRVRVTSVGAFGTLPDKCSTELNFVSAVTGNQTISADQPGNQVISVGNHADFKLKTDCSSGVISIYFQEDCSQVPTDQTTESTTSEQTPSTTTDFAMFPTPLGLLTTCATLILTLCVE
ncbi:unnamed protein product [Calicophoron daubneyi]|uniref:Uncharacterized protein n=1 Tax=Calicophoron daubneyi TaxID=300641 RepID=A0AAV2TWI1_CALDB